MHRARAARPRAFDSLPSQDPDPGRCPLSFSAGSSKIKIRTSSPYKAKLALYGDEVRILNFEDPAEPKAWKAGNVPDLDPVKCQTRADAPRMRCMKFFPKIYEIPRTTAARA